MTFTAIKLDGGKVVSYHSHRVRLIDVPGKWLKCHRDGYFVRFGAG